MKKRNILMCLEFLGVGGVETAVVTLCKGYVRAGHNVFVAAKDGMYAKELEKIGVKVLKMEHKIRNYFRIDKKKELVEFCKENKISEVHIHQYPCIMYWLPVCMELDIPYVAYAHSIVPGAIEWFTKEFPTYQLALPIFFENASKVVCIAESTKQEIEDIYHLGEDKYLIIPNSLNMEDFPNGEVPKKLEVFGIAARLSEEKVLSVEKGIDLFAEYAKENSDAKLFIAGDGQEKKTIMKYVDSKKLKDKVEFLGNVSNMPEYYKNLDVFIGVDRCILESLACKRLSIISSYTGTMNIVNKDNIELASNQNFSGMNLEDNEKVLQDLLKIDKKKYKAITEDNYKFINKKYNVDNNLYKDKLECTYTSDYKYIFNTTNRYTKEIYRINNKWPIKAYRYLINLFRRVIRKIKSIFGR